MPLLVLNNVCFVHSDFDDAGYDSATRSLFMHLARRSFKFNVCTAGIRSMAKHCKHRPSTIISSLRLLEHDGWIKIEKRKGSSSLIRITNRERKATTVIPRDNTPFPTRKRTVSNSETKEIQPKSVQTKGIPSDLLRKNLWKEIQNLNKEIDIYREDPEYRDQLKIWKTAVKGLNEQLNNMYVAMSSSAGSRP